MIQLVHEIYHFMFSCCMKITTNDSLKFCVIDFLDNLLEKTQFHACIPLNFIKSL